MLTALATLIDRLDSPEMSNTDVIHWGSPVPSFGDLSTATVATLGLNPSNREFMDDSGNELEGEKRRFHTLASLGIESWADADSRHLRLIVDSCQSYFAGNPYDRWFRRLDQILLGVSASYYSGLFSACHLDLIPYATSRKWTELAPKQRTALLDIAADTLALLLRDSDIRLLILNGKSVVDHFETVTGVGLERIPSACMATLSSEKRCAGLRVQRSGELDSGVHLRTSLSLSDTTTIFKAALASRRRQSTRFATGFRVSPRRSFVRPRDCQLADELRARLTAYDADIRELPGIRAPQRRTALIEQILESIHRVEYVKRLLKRPISPRRADPNDELFDPLKAAILHIRAGNPEEAFWLVFLFVHFGKHARAGWRYAREVYGRLGQGTLWNWSAVSAFATISRSASRT